MTEAERQLVDMFLDGELSDPQIADLATCLEKDPEAIAHLAERTLLLGGLRRAFKRRNLQQWALASSVSPQDRGALPKVNASRWLSVPPAAAVAGVVIGLLLASVAWAAALPWITEVRHSGKLVFLESFETGVTRTEAGLPREPSHWSGDDAEVVHGFAQVKPRSGGKMLRFESATYAGENSPRSQWGDVYRLVDVRGLASKERTVAKLTAHFAREPMTEEARYMGSVALLALDFESAQLPPALDLRWVQQNGSSTSSRKVSLSTPLNWHEVSAEVPITPETRFILLHLAMVHDSPSHDSGAVRFPGHYMDDVKLELVPAR